MVAPRGAIQMMSMADSSPASFSDFTGIAIGSKKLSSATVSKRLKDMLAMQVLEEVIQHSKSGRRVIAYKTTSRGKKILALIDELRESMRAAKMKPYF